MKELANGHSGFYLLALSLAFFPMYITGLDGQARRMYTYSESTGYGTIEYAFIYWSRLLWQSALL